MRDLHDALTHRFGDHLPDVKPPSQAHDAWQRLANRGVCRRFTDERVPDAMIDTLCALALSSPTKSDLQQRDILIVEDPAKRARINELLADQDWIPKAPHFLIFLGNNRRQRQIHQWRGRAFANDHLDAFFNAAVDAGIALSAFVIAAEAAGLGCCPVSVIRNHSAEVSRLFGMPDHVFPVAGLGFGWPSTPVHISARLPLAATVHRDRFDESSINEKIESYDRRRNSIFPYRAQRDVETFGEQADYGWSEDKARQYAKPERADFGAFVRAKGFNLE
jgi:nitroreductase/FMN reductase [NAD(P)H]